MDNKAQSLKNLIEKSNKILLIFPYVINADVAASVGLMAKLLREKFQKEVEIAASRNVPTRYHELLQKCGVDPNNLLQEIKPVSYVIHVNDAKDNINVDWNRTDDKVDFILTPERTEIDFSKVSFSKEGGYDLVITFNAQQLDDLGKVYQDYKSQYARYNIVSVDYQNASAEYGKLSLHDESSSTVSEIMYQLYKQLGYNPDNKDAEVVAHGLLGSTHGLHYVTKYQTYDVISELANKYKVDSADIITKYFYSLGQNELKLREKILKNVKFDDSKKAIYSQLTLQDFGEAGVKPNDIDGMDYLPFNVCKGYEIAFLAYEDNGKSTVLIHSNSSKRDITDIIRTLGGYGNKSFGIVTFSENAQAAAQKVLNALGGSSSDSGNNTNQSGSNQDKPDTSSSQDNGQNGNQEQQSQNEQAKSQPEKNKDQQGKNEQEQEEKKDASTGVMTQEYQPTANTTPAGSNQPTQGYGNAQSRNVPQSQPAMSSGPSTTSQGNGSSPAGNPPSAPFQKASQDDLNKTVQSSDSQGSNQQNAGSRPPFDKAA